jgi:hypothetical protein
MKKVIDEKCSCGHYKSQHFGSIVTVGHGPCAICICKRFTWSGYVYSYSNNTKEGK